ncbi:unnamed protein product [Linum trigynum]|uniref:BAH domain-containing protein n=1 Tax=Linum trigynum TaxID=586398 RepID=A0AAV2DYD5_9ROSI
MGDCVLIRPNATGDEHPFLARIEGIDFYSVNNVHVHVRRYYRPDETFQGVHKFHGKKEVFLSDRWQIVGICTVEGKCTVHSLDDYIKLGNVGAEDYFFIFEYKHESRGFSPDNVCVYCICDMPGNPDLPMIQRRECRNR